VSWTTLQSIFRHYFHQDPSTQQDWSQVRRIGIDEIALKKGHKDFVIILVDLDTKQILDILNFRTKAKLKAYFLSKGAAFCEQITEYVADFWEGYHTVAKEVFPNVCITGDRFHAFSQLQKGLDNHRKAARKAESTKDLEILKRAKYVLLKNPKNLTAKQKIHLAALRKEELLTDLMKVYDLKIELQTIFNRKVKRNKAAILVQKWVEKVEALEHNYLKPFLNFLDTWKDTILNYFYNRLTTGIVEGKNNKLKLIKRRAFGFVNFENFRIKAIYDCSVPLIT
jgi:transposase